MAGSSANSNPNNMLSTSRQLSNEQSKFISRNDDSLKSLVLYLSNVFIGNTITENAFNNEGNGNQDFSSADINRRTVSATRSKQFSPVTAPSTNFVSTNLNQYGSLNAGVRYCLSCKEEFLGLPGEFRVHCRLCDDILLTITCGRVMEVTSVNYKCDHHDAPNSGNI